MATTMKVKLTQEQREEIAESLRIELQSVPKELGVIAVSPEASKMLGLPEDMGSKFSPALIVT